MPRRSRIHVPGAFYHVTLRGNHRQDIFVAEHDRALLNVIVARSLDKYGARLHAYCWMRNHLHLLVQVGTEPLSNPMRDLAGEFARAMQAKLVTTGHFFEHRYHANLVDTDSYLKELVRYIHLNPVAAGVVDHPARFPWSSHHVYSGTRDEPWVTTDFVLGIFGSSRKAAISAYLEFVASDDAGEWQPPDVQLEPLTDRRFDRAVGLVPNAPAAVGSRKSLDELVADACARFEVSREVLAEPIRNSYLTKVRAWIANHAVKQRIASLSDVARLLGRDEATLREAMRRYPHEVE
jgi:REP element-mobilizing transposase RayT